MQHKNIITGSFDPPTHGHLSIIRRASALLGGVTVVVCSNLDKKHMFEPWERVAMMESMVADIPKTKVASLEPGSMISTFTRAHQSKVLVRGVRNGLDLEYERSIEEFVREYGIEEVVYLLNEPGLANISSSIARNHLRVMKEYNRFNATIVKYLPATVLKSLVQLDFAKNFMNRGIYI